VGPARDLGVDRAAVRSIRPGAPSTSGAGNSVSHGKMRRDAQVPAQHQVARQRVLGAIAISVSAIPRFRSAPSIALMS
jgi:hypothetical protein